MNPIGHEPGSGCDEFINRRDRFVRKRHLKPTPAQWQTVLDNIGLAHEFAWTKAMVSKQDVPEWMSDIGVPTLLDCAIRYDPKRGPKFSTYVYKSLYYRCSAARKVAGRKPRFSESERTPEGETRDDEVDDGPDVEQILAPLQEKFAQVIFERIIMGRTLAQVGRRLGVTKERVRQIQNEAMYILRTKHRATIA